MFVIRLFVLGLTLIFLAGSAAAGDEALAWRPLSQDELQLKTSTVEPGADAEGIFWEVWLDDRDITGLYWDHYVRIKIFTARGQEKFSKLDIQFSKGQKIEKMAARVIRPNGTVVTLDPKDIFEREIVKVGRNKVLAKSFAIPAIEPGVILEYRFRETISFGWADGVKLAFQQDVPFQKITYHVRPKKGYKLVSNFFNMPAAEFVDDVTMKGYVVASASNVPAYKVEPNMPPEDEVRMWAIVGYTVGDAKTWNDFFRSHVHWLTELAKVTNPIKQKAADITFGKTGDEEKLRIIYGYVQSKVKNIEFDRPPTEKEQLAFEMDVADDTLKRGSGDATNISLLFAALAKASGFEVNLAFSGDRSTGYFAPKKYPYPSFLKFAGVAVKLNSRWKYFNPGIPYLPYGDLPWYRQGTVAMVLAPETLTWENIRVDGAERSPSKRSAKLTLSEDGTLEGSVRLEYSGQQAFVRRATLFPLVDEARTLLIVEDLKARISTAEVSEVRFENITDASKSLIFTYRIKIPNYAQRTGQRLFLQPSIFQYGAEPLFSAATRIHNIHFLYPWSESDDIAITLPQGFEAESLDQPEPVVRKVASLSSTVSIDKSENILRFKRNFSFGDESGNRPLYHSSGYAPIKGIFDSVHKADSHVVALKGRKV